MISFRPLNTILLMAICHLLAASISPKSLVENNEKTATSKTNAGNLLPAQYARIGQPESPANNSAKLILRSPMTNSPGNIIDYSCREFQCDGSMGRRIATGYPQDQYTHMVWVHQENLTYWDLQAGIYYQVYNNGSYEVTSGGIDISSRLYDTGPSLSVLPDNRVVVGYDYTQIQSYLGYNLDINIEIQPDLSIFATYPLFPDSLAEWYQTGMITGMPSVEVHNGTETVIYALTQAVTSELDVIGQVLYRKVGETGFDNGQLLEANFGWFNTIVGRQNTDSVAAVYIDRNWEGGGDNSARLNTVYRLSTDQGATWGPVVNVSNYSLDSMWQTETEVSALWDDNGDLHVVWHARERVDDHYYWIYRCRILHWSTADQLTSTIAEARYDAECFSNRWDMNAGRLSLSLCEGNLYVSWAQFNDYDISDDCSEGGYANGEIYMAASDDNGLTWDTAVNLTNTRTPGCIAGGCESDVYPSMIRYGAEYADARDSLDIIYINDKDAGVAHLGQGTWTVNNVMHYRIPCRDVVHIPRIAVEPLEFGYPMIIEPGQTMDTSFAITNIGNGLLNWEASVNYITGAEHNWLAVNPPSGAVDKLPNNTGTAILAFDSQELLGNPSVWEAEVIISSSDYPDVVEPDTIRVTLIVASDSIQPKADTLNTAGRSLIVYNTGQIGANHRGYSLNVPDDCDTVDTYPMSDIYLYDASPVISYINDADDTIAYTAIFEQQFIDPETFMPQGGFAKTSETDYDLVQYSSMTTDSIFGISVTFIVPTDGSCFIFGKNDYYLIEGVSDKSSVCLGMICDWDIPSDTLVDNGSDFDDSLNTIWQYGAEYHEDNQGFCSINESDRLGGVVLISGTPRNAWTEDNQACQEPPAYDQKFLYSQMSSLSDFNLYTPGYGEKPLIDLHIGITFSQTDITPSDTFSYLYCLITTNQGSSDYYDQLTAAYNWAFGHILPEAVSPGDANSDGQVNVGDAVYLISYIFKGGPPPIPYEVCSGDANGDCQCNVGDAVYIISYVFKGGPAPVEYLNWYLSCGSP